MLIDGLIDIQCTNFEEVEEFFEGSTLEYYDENTWLNIKDIPLLLNSEDMISKIEPIIEKGNATCFMTLLDNEYGYVKAYFENGVKIFYCNYVFDMHYLRKNNKELMNFFINAMERPYPILKETYEEIKEMFDHDSNVELWNKLCDWHSEIYLIITPYCFEVLDQYFNKDIEQYINLEDNQLQVIH